MKLALKSNSFIKGVVLSLYYVYFLLFNKEIKLIFTIYKKKNTYKTVIIKLTNDSANVLPIERGREEIIIVARRPRESINIPS